MIKLLSFLATLTFSTQVWSHVSLDFGLGAQFARPDYKKRDLQDSQSLAAQISIGKQWENWGLDLLGTYSFGEQKSFEQDYGDKVIRDDFWAHSLSAGPIVSYRFKSDSDWSFSPFIGPHFQYLGLESSTSFTDTRTGEEEELSSENWGYGGTTGIQFEQKTKNSKWLDAISYRVTYQYSRYRESEATYDINQEEVEYDGDTPGKLTEHALTFTIGMSLGSKLL